ncbi:hypothetical protein KQH82_09465 [bacterium]|nr:hypothetical protein [bacterium]
MKQYRQPCEAGVCRFRLPAVRLAAAVGLVLLLALQLSAQVVDGRLVLTPQSLAGAERECAFGGEWRYHPGDNPAWAAAELDHSGWRLMNTALRQDEVADSVWPGIGWFRLEVFVDSALVAMPLGLTLEQAGASEIYLNGERLFAFGTVGSTQITEVSEIRTWSQPHAFVFAEAGENVIAVRYSNQRWYQIRLWGGETGFFMKVGSTDEMVRGYSGNLLSSGRYQAFFTAFSLSLALLHLFIFVFYPSARENIYYAVLAFAFAGICWMPTELSLLKSFAPFAVHMLAFKIFLLLTAVAGPCVLYSIFYERLPRYAYALIIAGIVVMAVSWWLPLAWVYVFSFVSLVESLRVVILAVARRRRFAWIIGVGYSLFCIAAGYQMLPEFTQVIQRYQLVYYPYYMWGIFALLVSMSLFLARSFAATHVELSRRLAEVEVLSARAIEQERDALQAETKRKLLEANLEHQSRELERARELEKAHRELFEANRTLRDTQAQLVQSEKMASLGSLVAGIAHELNTPIGAVNSMHHTLMRAFGNIREALEDSATAPQEAMLQRNFDAINDANRVIGSGTERVMNIVKRLRSFARLDEAELKTVDIHEGIEDTLTLIHHEIKHHVTVVRNFGKLPPIPCYPGQLNQVFLNLLNNARQAIVGEGTITITTAMKDGLVRIGISDTGTGIKPEHLEKIFDPGFTTKGVGVGTGLGLSICYQIVQKHFGKIEVASEVGKGTTFTIILPTDLDKRVEAESAPR